MLLKDVINDLLSFTVFPSYTSTDKIKSEILLYIAKDYHGKQEITNHSKS
jgi:hypothetical protein